MTTLYLAIRHETIVDTDRDVNIGLYETPREAILACDWDMDSRWLSDVYHTVSIVRVGVDLTNPLNNKLYWQTGDPIPEE